MSEILKGGKTSGNGLEGNQTPGEKIAAKSATVLTQDRPDQFAGGFMGSHLGKMVLPVFGVSEDYSLKSPLAKRSKGGIFTV